MNIRKALSILVAVSAVSANAASYHLGTYYNPLYVGNASGCARGWYDPEIVTTLPYVPPTGGTYTDLLLYGQGTNDQGPVPFKDEFYRMRRDALSGAWDNNVSDPYRAPAVQGNYNRCGTTVGHISSPSVVRVAEAASPTGYRYYMAFVGGNADIWQGKIYWAKSNDGLNWTYYNSTTGGVWTPIIYSKYGNDCAPHGIGQVQLALENGIFYLYMQFWHSTGAITSETFRMDYNPAGPWGVGSAVRQVWQNGAWLNNTGRFVFNYDPTGSTPEPGDTVLVPQYSSFGFGAGDVKLDPVRNQWVHAYAFGPTYIQTTASLATNSWSTPVQLDMTALTGTATSKYPNGGQYYPGLWYGALGNVSAQMWIYMPVNQPGCGDWKTMIVPAKLDYY